MRPTFCKATYHFNLSTKETVSDVNITTYDADDVLNVEPTDVIQVEENMGPTVVIDHTVATGLVVPLI